MTNLPRHAWLARPACLDRRSAPGARAGGRGDPNREKATGIGKFPSYSFALNQAWLAAALIAAVLLAWLRLIALDGPLARAEPKTLRYRVLHAAGRLAANGRRRRLKIAAAWPWASAIVHAWERVTALPHGP